MAFITDSTRSIKREFLAVGFQSLQLPKRLQSSDLEANAFGPCYPKCGLDQLAGASSESLLEIQNLELH